MFCMTQTLTLKPDTQSELLLKYKLSWQMLVAEASKQDVSPNAIYGRLWRLDHAGKEEEAQALADDLRTVQTEVVYTQEDIAAAAEANDVEVGTIIKRIKQGATLAQAASRGESLLTSLGVTWADLHEMADDQGVSVDALYRRISRNTHKIKNREDALKFLSAGRGHTYAKDDKKLYDAIVQITRRNQGVPPTLAEAAEAADTTVPRLRLSRARLAAQGLVTDSGQLMPIGGRWIDDEEVDAIARLVEFGIEYGNAEDLEAAKILVRHMPAPEITD